MFGLAFADYQPTLWDDRSITAAESTVEARRAYVIGPTSAGRVKAVQIDVGDVVAAGELVAEMDPVDLGDFPERSYLWIGLNLTFYVISPKELG